MIDAPATIAVTTWTEVASLLITTLPALIAAVAACLAVWKGQQNASAIERVHVLTNSTMTALKRDLEDMRTKLEVSLAQVGTLTNEPAKTIAEAPTAPPGR